MSNVKYCRNCYKQIVSDDPECVDFCSDECEKEYQDTHSAKVLACARCCSTDNDLAVYKVSGKEVVLCDKCFDKYNEAVSEFTDQFTGIDKFEIAAKYILMGLHDMGFETDYANFHDTPKRFARAYSEIFSGCKNTEDQVDAILATSFPSQGAENMVVAKDIVCFSMCPHHLLPVEYHVCVGYIPSKGGDVLGISKLARLVNVLAKRPALQETFTQEIVDYLGPDNIGSKGAIAYVEGQHMCMRMRGAKATNTTITTTSVSGYFLDNPSTKQEFMSNIVDRLKFRG